MISPTGYGIRGRDKWGSGCFGASRGKRTHKGVDFICTPGQRIWFPFEYGYMVREARPYAKTGFSGCEITAFEGDKYYLCKMFYFNPDLELVSKSKGIKMGEPIGVAQDISVKYPDITWHIHLQVAELHCKTKWFDPQTIWEVPQWH